MGKAQGTQAEGTEISGLKLGNPQTTDEMETNPEGPAQSADTEAPEAGGAGRAQGTQRSEGLARTSRLYPKRATIKVLESNDTMIHENYFSEGRRCL